MLYNYKLKTYKTHTHTLHTHTNTCTHKHMHTPLSLWHTKVELALVVSSTTLSFITHSLLVQARSGVLFIHVSRAAWWISLAIFRNVTLVGSVATHGASRQELALLRATLSHTALSTCHQLTGTRITTFVCALLHGIIHSHNVRWMWKPSLQAPTAL